MSTGLCQQSGPNCFLVYCMPKAFNICTLNNSYGANVLNVSVFYIITQCLLSSWLQPVIEAEGQHSQLNCDLTACCTLCASPLRFLFPLEDKWNINLDNHDGKMQAGDERGRGHFTTFFLPIFTIFTLVCKLKRCFGTLNSHYISNIEFIKL